eukprot:CAMPEP_0184306592 /NCGR_PEP_ID=MMETSP1049-20130417/15550_1 /TAXON_ID=77928 /ORGANISM="Proteomonas sulcata, Strain CCMP704" /LENGTH=40 /DNA_ID= /DNA_START= /DNA_END= /DNA_ORIENTATION=
MPQGQKKKKRKNRYGSVRARYQALNKHRKKKREAKAEDGV